MPSRIWARKLAERITREVLDELSRGLIEADQDDLEAGLRDLIEKLIRRKS